ncbi:hypothetical protein N658DRAFT_522198 [Parathielavia hyrcaniae]|uniref:Uncharacterized protein n=1 Tax=Parathielavia hyrcaniae TaxID=113614 RepID=A0AAN6Q4N1_9PEZI|nr:hypothetical protein N658DRAFT_522198 [Parathielavia hyrcaniae]
MPTTTATTAAVMRALQNIGHQGRKHALVRRVSQSTETRSFSFTLTVSIPVPVAFPILPVSIAIQRSSPPQPTPLTILLLPLLPLPLASTTASPSLHERRERPRPGHAPQPLTPFPPTHPLPRSAGLALAQEAAQHALEAGAKAAVRLRDDPSPWLGRKGGQIAAAALSAAVVDTFVARRHPKMRKGGMRHSFATQAAQMVFGGLVPGGNDGNAAGAGTRKKGGVGSRMGGLRGRM